MNLNILTIDVLSAVPAQPAHPNSARNSQKTDGFDGFETENSKISSENEHFSKKLGQKSQNEGITNPSVLQPSDIPDKMPLKDKTTQVSGFENVLKRQLKSAESFSESADAKAATKPQNSGQIQPLGRSQSSIAPLVEQKQNSPDAKQDTNKTTPIKQTAIQIPQTSQENKQADSLVNQTRNIQKDTSEPINSAAIQTNQEQKVISSSIKQIRDISETPAEIKKTTENNKPVETGSVKDADVKKPNLISNNALDWKAAKNPDAASQVKPGTDFVKEAGTIQQQASAGGQTSETANDRVTDKPLKERQSVLQAADKQEVNRFSQKLNADKTEILSAKSDSAKSEFTADSAQAATGKIAAIDSYPVAANSPPNVTGRTSVTSANVPAGDNAASLREQIIQSVRTTVQQGTNQIKIRLNPPVLGQVSVKFSEKNNELTGLLEATNAQTRAEIRQAIPDIIRSLEESGITIKRIDVTLSDLPRQSSQQQSTRDNAPQDLWDQFSRQGFRNDHSNQHTQDSYLTPSYSDNTAATANDVQAVAFFGRNQNSSSDNRLDVLI